MFNFSPRVYFPYLGGNLQKILDLTGDFSKDSDIDIFILIKKKDKLEGRISEIAADYFFETGVPLSPVIYSLFEYKKIKI